ncbi:MAG: hypothetical protein ACXACW_12850, partial [Candidatus Hodarchaeales archaeon]
LYHSLEHDGDYYSLKDDWLPLMDDTTPRFLVETDYLDSRDEDWITSKLKNRPPNEAEEIQKKFNCIKRFFCKIRDTQCTRDIFSYLLDFLSNISPKDE